MRTLSFAGGTAFHSTLPARVQETPCRRAEAKPASSPDSFHKGQGSTFLLPPKSLVVVIPGMFSSKPSIDGLSEYLQSQGHTVYPMLLADILVAQSTDHARKVLAKKVDNIRISAAAKNSVALSWNLEGKTGAQQKQVLQQFFQLQNTPEGRAIADAILDLLQDRSFHLLDRLKKLTPQDFPAEPTETKSAYPDDGLGLQLCSILRDTQVQLSHNLRNSRNPKIRAMSNEDLSKITQAVLDGLAPRVVIVGHSLGGFVATRELLGNLRDVGMVISLGSPVNGTPGSRIVKLQAPQIPDALLNLGASSIRPAIRKFLQAILHMAPDSPEVKQIQTGKLPFDTFAFSVSNPKDGLVGPENASHNEKLGNRLNLVVTPMESDFKILLMSEQRKRLEAMGKLNPLKPALSRINRTVALNGVRHHMGLVEHFEDYWTYNGDMLHQVLEDPEKIRSLLEPANNDAMRVQLLELMAQELRTFPQAAGQYRALIPDLQRVSQEKRPFIHGVDTMAKRVLALLN